jgi:tartrate-resistant acid phosphatase type 5
MRRHQDWSLDSLERRTLLSAPVHFAMIGDFGLSSQPELDVANMVKSWNPDFIVTDGDNNYPSGAASTIDQNIGQYYHDYIFNYHGTFGPGSATQRFWPVLGNHDWGNKIPNPNGANPYLNYFTLPGNERYYDFVQGPVHFFMLDSYGDEPDGITSTSIQAQWLQAGLAAATEPYKIVVLHHPPYSSGTHGSLVALQWPFAQWGATVDVAGHDHDYERLLEGGLTYLVNGVGGNDLDVLSRHIAGSQAQFGSDFGALLVDADDQRLQFQFYSRLGQLIDTYVYNFVPDATPPSVTSENFLPDAPKMTAQFGFSENVFASVSAGDLQLTNTTTGATIPPASIALAYDGLTNTANFTYTGATNGILPDGNYHAVLPAGSVQDSSGNSTTAATTLDFFVLAADANRDRKVDLTDFAVLTSNFNTTGKRFSQGNFSYDAAGAVDLTDFTFLASNFNSALPAPTSVVPRLAVPGPPLPASFSTTIERAPVRAHGGESEDLLDAGSARLLSE